MTNSQWRNSNNEKLARGTWSFFQKSVNKEKKDPTLQSEDLVLDEKAKYRCEL